MRRRRRRRSPPDRRTDQGSDGDSDGDSHRDRNDQRIRDADAGSADRCADAAADRERAPGDVASAERG
jgi:hypothetical protein